MILQKEISTIATQNGVVNTTIDKDWALGHFLDAIFSIPQLREKLMFKGGTCIKKCYIEDYRFSEDLDFTASDENFRLTNAHLTQITELLKERVVMQTHIQSLRELRYENKLTGYEAIIKFWGADHPRNETPPADERWQTKVKIEVILYETILFSSDNKNVIHNYSDILTENAKNIPCYSILEILSEKMRVLVQRSYSAPRDIYDLWTLSGKFTDINLEELKVAFKMKMEYKGLTFTGVEQLLNPENDRILKSAWKNSLRHQVQGDLAEFEEVKGKLEKWLKSFMDVN